MKIEKECHFSNLNVKKRCLSKGSSLSVSFWWSMLKVAIEIFLLQYNFRNISKSSSCLE